jgi:hypothetical protein
MKRKYLLALIICCFLFGGIWVAYGQGQKEKASITKWEYKCIVIVRQGRSNADWSDWAEMTGTEVKTLALPVAVPKRASELGEQGWELFTITPVSNNAGGANSSSDLAGFTSQILYWFKRPR